GLERHRGELEHYDSLCRHHQRYPVKQQRKHERQHTGCAIAQDLSGSHPHGGAEPAHHCEMPPLWSMNSASKFARSWKRCDTMTTLLPASRAWFANIQKLKYVSQSRPAQGSSSSSTAGSSSSATTRFSFCFEPPLSS